jgi:RNA polymerase sigma-54 factor
VPFDTFFRPALAIHDVMRELIATEGQPMTDGAIGRALAARGIHIARRTVSKYLQMGALSSAQRTEPWAA